MKNLSLFVWYHIKLHESGVNRNSNNRTDMKYDFMKCWKMLHLCVNFQWTWIHYPITSQDRRLNQVESQVRSLVVVLAYYQLPIYSNSGKFPLKMKGISSSGMKKQTSSQSSSSRPKLKDSFVTGTLIAKRFWKHLNVIPFFREKPAGKCFLALILFFRVFSWSAIVDLLVAHTPK